MFLIGCSPYIEPSAVGLPQNQVAILLGQQSMLLDGKNGSVIVRSIDGNRIKNIVTKSYTIKPGKRILTVGYESGAYRSIGSQKLVAEFKSGKIYEARAEIEKQSLVTWKPYIYEQNTKNVVSKIIE